MTADPTVLAARAQVIASKARLDASLSHAKAKLSPRSLAADAVETATDKATQAAHTGIRIARDRPGTAAAVVGAIGLTLAHRPIIGWIGSLFGRRDATADDDAS